MTWKQHGSLSVCLSVLLFTSAVAVGVGVADGADELLADKNFKLNCINVDKAILIRP